MKTLTFTKDKDNRWWVVLPEWEGDPADLEMVSGADTLCDMLTQNIYDELTVHASTDYFTIGHAGINVVLSVERPEAEGMWYTADLIDSLESVECWLCHVTEHIFGEFPETIYLRVV